MRLYLKVQRRDALLDHIVRLGLIQAGRSLDGSEWQKEFDESRSQTWDGMCRDIIGQPASPDAPLAEPIVDQMTEALTKIQKDLKTKTGDGKT